MPEAPLPRSTNNEIPDPDALIVQSHDERARTRYSTALLNHAMMNMRYQMWDVYRDTVEPKLKKKLGRAAKSGKEIYHAMKDVPQFQAYSSVRYNAQEMGPLTAVEVVERVAPAINNTARSGLAAAEGCGSLRMKPDITYPNYLTAMDSHLVPGGFWSERHDGDMSQAMVYQVRRLAGPIGNAARDFAGVGISVATYLSRKYPDFKPRRVLDVATMEGRQLYAYGDVFPGTELHGLDIAAPSLRYGHIQAARKGIPIHFSQQNAESIDYPDGFFDLIVSSFFLHEISVPATKRVLAECYRLLAPGGIMAHMELPPSKSVSPLQTFTFDWDCRFNNEPHYAHYRAQDPSALCAAAGFSKAGLFEVTVPQVGMMKPADYDRFMRGEVEAPPHGRGGWFIFGGRK